MCAVSDVYVPMPCVQSNVRSSDREIWGSDIGL